MNAKKLYRDNFIKDIEDQLQRGLTNIDKFFELFPGVNGESREVVYEGIRCLMTYGDPVAGKAVLRPLNAADKLPGAKFAGQEVEIVV